MSFDLYQIYWILLIAVLFYFCSIHLLAMHPSLSLIVITFVSGICLVVNSLVVVILMLDTDEVKGE